MTDAIATDAAVKLAPPPKPAPAPSPRTPDKPETAMNSEPAKPAADAAKPAPAPLLPPIASGPVSPLARWAGRKQVAIAASAMFSLIAGVAGLRLMLPSSDDGKSTQTPMHPLASEPSMPSPATGSPPAPIPPTTLPTGGSSGQATAPPLFTSMQMGSNKARFKLTDTTFGMLRRMSVPDLVLNKLAGMKDMEYPADDFERAITRELGPDDAKKYGQTIVVVAMIPDANRVPDVAPNSAPGGPQGMRIPIAQISTPPAPSGSTALPIPTIPTAPPAFPSVSVEPPSRPTADKKLARYKFTDSVLTDLQKKNIPPYVVLNLKKLKDRDITQAELEREVNAALNAEDKRYYEFYLPTIEACARESDPLAAAPLMPLASSVAPVPAIPARPPEYGAVSPLPNPTGLQPPPTVQPERGNRNEVANGAWQKNVAAPSTPVPGQPGPTQLPKPAGGAPAVPAVTPSFPDIVAPVPPSNLKPSVVPPVAPSIVLVSGAEPPKSPEPAGGPGLPAVPPIMPAAPAIPPAALTQPAAPPPAIPGNPVVPGAPPGPATPGPMAPSVPAIPAPSVSLIPSPTDLSPKPAPPPPVSGLNPSLTPTVGLPPANPAPLTPPAPSGLAPWPAPSVPPTLQPEPSAIAAPAMPGPSAQSGNRGGSPAPVAPVQPRITPSTSVVPASASGTSASTAPQRSPSTSYDEDLYETKANDTWESISQEFYNNKSYAAALKAYNHQGAATPLGTVNVPPIYILKQKYQAPGKAASSNSQSAGPPPATSWGPSTATTPAGTMVDAKIYRVPSGGASMRTIARNTLGGETRWVEIYNLNPQLRPDLVPEGAEVRLPADARMAN